MKFDELGLSKELLEAINKLGFTEPTQIQEKAIPHIVEGRDVMGESATGSGKTVAFGCGIIQNAIPKHGLQALVLTPTRELAEQVKDELKKLASQKKLKVTTVYGGVSIEPQIHALTKADVVVATPGRLLDHLQRGTIDLSEIKLLVLDEADRMLDMGFIDDVERIMQACPKERQTLFFSATLASRIKELAERYMKEPVKVSAKVHVDPSKLKQVYYDVGKNMKLSLIVHLLKEEDDSGLVMVFCNSRRNTDFLIKNLRAHGLKVVGLHGGFTQNKRTKTIQEFNKFNKGVLVCTDVAARGLHIDNVSHVYNYDIPKDPKDYVHRIGRTARAGESGRVINLLCEYDYDNFDRVHRDYDFNIEKEEAPEVQKVRAIVEDRPQGRRPFRRHGDRHGGRGGDRRGPSRGSSRGGPRGSSRSSSKGPRGKKPFNKQGRRFSGR